MFRTPDTYGYFTLSYNPVKALTLAMDGTFTGNMLVQHLKGSGTPVDRAVVTKRFADVSFKATYMFSLFGSAEMSLTAGLQNIFNSYQDDFDRGSLRDSGYIYGPSRPRTLLVGLSLHI